MIPQWIREHNAQCGGPTVAQVVRLMARAFSLPAFPKLTPLLSQVRKSSAPSKWGGQGIFWDVVISKHAPPGQVYVLPNQGTIVVPNTAIKRAYVNLNNLPVIQNPQRGMITGITL